MSPGRWALPSGMFSTRPRMPTALTLALRAASAYIAPATAAEPAMSVIISSMPSAGLRLMPPVSKQTPLPTKAIGGALGVLGALPLDDHQLALAHAALADARAASPCRAWSSPSRPAPRPRGRAWSSSLHPPGVLLRIEDVGRLGDQVAGEADGVGERWRASRSALAAAFGSATAIARTSPTASSPASRWSGTCRTGRRPAGCRTPACACRSGPRRRHQQQQLLAAAVLGGVVGVGAGALGAASRRTPLCLPAPTTSTRAGRDAGRRQDLHDLTHRALESARRRPPASSRRTCCLSSASAAGEILAVLERQHRERRGLGGLGVGGDEIDLHGWLRRGRTPARIVQPAGGAKPVSYASLR